MIPQDRTLLSRLSKATASAGQVNALAGRVVLRLLDQAEDTGDLEPHSLLRLADALAPVADELNAVLVALRRRAAELGVVDATAANPPAELAQTAPDTEPDTPSDPPTSQ